MVKVVFSTNDIGAIGYLYGKKMKTDPYLTPYKKIRCRWIINLNMKDKNIKFYKEDFYRLDIFIE